MTKILNSKPIYDFEERTIQRFGHWILGFEIFNAFMALNHKG